MTDEDIDSCWLLRIDSTRKGLLNGVDRKGAMVRKVKSFLAVSARVCQSEGGSGSA